MASFNCKSLYLLVLLIVLSSADGQQHYYEKTIQKFEAQDRRQFPASDAILFIGSSSIRGWKTVARDFPEAQTINRGFGGSRTEDVLHFVDRIVVPYKPRAIVFYCGENDIAGGKPATTPVADFKKFVSHIRRTLPTTQIYYVSMKPSPRRWKLWPQMKLGNQQIKRFCQHNVSYQGKQTLFYIDVSQAMLNDKGKPSPEIFILDMLHMNAKGYTIWTRIIKRALVRHGSLPTATSNSSDAVWQILSLEKERYKAMVKGHFSVLEWLLAPDMLFIHSNGRIDTKQSLLANLKSKRVQYKKIEIQNIAARVYGSCGVVNGCSILDITAANRKLKLKLLFTTVYSKHNDKWQMVSYQSTYASK